jgi:hypothetical protein
MIAEQPAAAATRIIGISKEGLDIRYSVMVDPKVTLPHGGGQRESI